MMKFLGVLPLAMAASAAAQAPAGEINYPQGSLGYDALVSANYKVAEDQIKGDEKVSSNDPAKLINLGQIYLNTGRRDQAIAMFEKAMRVRNVQLVLASGRVVGSRDLARQALERAGR